ncbi:MAG: hypothetical protein U0228_09580 [Myxococcaceae bacterium]
MMTLTPWSCGGAQAWIIGREKGVGSRAWVVDGQPCCLLGYGDGAGGDARRKPLELTAQGRAVVELSVRLQRQLEVRWAELAGARHVTAMRRVLEKVVIDERTIAPPVRMSVPSPLQRRGSG